MIKWVFEKDFFNDNLEKEVIKRGNHIVYIDHNSDFSGLGDTEPIMYRGGLSKIHMFKNPPVHIQRYRCTEYYSYRLIGQHLLNKDAAFYLPRLLDPSSIKYPVFVRPDSGFKYFTGFVANSAKDIEYALESLSDSQLCMISSVKDIVEEYRFVIGQANYENFVIAGSMYSPECMTVQPDHKVWKFIQSVLDQEGSSPDDMYTLDACVLRDGSIKIVELNSFSCAGLYECNVERIVSFINTWYKNWI